MSADSEKKYWLSVDQLKDSEKYKETLEEFYSRYKSSSLNYFSRRNFLTLMGATVAMATLTGCRRPIDKIVPYVSQPESIIPGVPEYFATSMPVGNSSYGLIVECHEGRPTKIEGNPVHPSTRGSSNAQIQASILGLYDPDRSKHVMHNGVQESHDSFV
ncbi:MAG: TAT-variant-translocated molybdopterin oxidoreductase, partial [candidate division Zixibacteria bacterium]|nr:TAT-variant-translocated molybdopterin oxidoreductase [candidate division Zixibacteria bacterium]